MEAKLGGKPLLGKLKTVSQAAAVVVLLFPEYEWHSMIIAVVLTLVSGWNYFRDAARFLK